MRSAPDLEDSLAGAIERREAGDLVGALRQLERLTSERPDEARAELEAGRTLLLLGLPGHAAERLDRAAELEPELPGLEVERGRGAALRGRLEEAQLRFEHAVETSPTTRAFVELARILRLLDEPERALEVLANSTGAADDGEDVAAEALEERALALVSLGRLDDAVPILHELLAAGGRADNVWRAALVLTARKEFEEALTLVELFEEAARRHARDVVFYYRRVESIRAAQAAFEGARAHSERDPAVTLVDLHPFLADDEQPLDGVDLARAPRTHPTKCFVLDPPDDERYRSAVLALRARIGEDGTVPYRVARPVCFQYLVPHALLARSGAQYAVFDEKGAFAPDLVPVERFPAAVARFAARERRSGAEPLELAFLTPLLGWENHFQTVVQGLATLGLYRRLALTCPIVVPGPPNMVQAEVIEASGIPRETAILTADEVLGRPIGMAVCATRESSARLLRQWAHDVLEHVSDGGPDDTSRVLYISRGPTSRRALVNEGTLEEKLRSAWGAAIVRMEELTFREQVRAARSASVVVAPHGAGLTNLLFTREDAVVVELVPDRYPNVNYARLAANAKRLYVSLTGQVEEARGADDLPWRVDVSRVEAVLERLLGHR